MSAALDLEGRVIRLEARAESQDKDIERIEQQGHDFGARLRVVEAAQVSMAAKLTIWAVVGSGLATAILQFAIKRFG